eukprot:m.78115 g.78115  ORF g.78115 m.78115 type:complete len:954 (-) comp12658_c1_seq2:185-3046(-)
MSTAQQRARASPTRNVSWFEGEISKLSFDDFDDGALGGVARSGSGDSDTYSSTQSNRQSNTYTLTSLEPTPPKLKSWTDLPKSPTTLPAFEPAGEGIISPFSSPMGTPTTAHPPDNRASIYSCASNDDENNDDGVAMRNPAGRRPLAPLDMSKSKTTSAWDPEIKSPIFGQKFSIEEGNILDVTRIDSAMLDGIIFENEVNNITLSDQQRRRMSGMSLIGTLSNSDLTNERLESNALRYSPNGSVINGGTPSTISPHSHRSTPTLHNRPMSAFERRATPESLQSFVMEVIPSRQKLMSDTYSLDSDLVRSPAASENSSVLNVETFDDDTSRDGSNILDLYKRAVIDVFHGVPLSSPKAYLHVAHGLSHELSKMQHECSEVDRKRCKKLVLQTIAHCDTFARHESAGLVERWYDIINGVCSELLAALPGQLQASIRRGGSDLAYPLNVPCTTPKTKKKSFKKRNREEHDDILRQSKYISYLQPAFHGNIVTAVDNFITAQQGNQDNNSYATETDYASLFGTRSRSRMIGLVKLAMFYIHSYYIDTVFLGEAFKDIAGKYGSVKWAPLRNVRKIDDKLQDSLTQSDGADPLVNTVHRSLVCSTREQQQGFVDEMEARHKNEYTAISAYSTMQDPQASIKHDMVHYLYHPTSLKAPRKPLARKKQITFSDMISDSIRRQEAVSACMHRNSATPAFVFEIANKLLAHKKLSNQSIAMVVEVELFLPHFLRKSKIQHLWSCIQKPNNGPALTASCKAYAKVDDMSPSSKVDAATSNYLSENCKSLCQTTWLWDYQIVNLEMLCPALRTHTTLSILSLNGCNLGPKGADQVMKTLRKISSLRELALDDNELHEVGAEAVAEFLRDTKCLQKLSMRLNDIGPVGGAHIATALATNTTLTHLSIDNNMLGQSTFSIAYSLRDNRDTKMKSLRIADGNDINEEGVSSICSFLSNSRNINITG